MNDIIRKEDSFDVAIVEIDNTQKVCERLMKTPHYAKLGNDGVYAILSKAKSLNIHPLEALNGGLYYVQGKVGMSAEMMNALIRQRGHSIQKDPKSDDKVCILHGKRADNNDTWTVSFSLEDARKAGLLKNMYDKYPAIMLYNRAMSMLARQLFPDVIKGAGYTSDELKEIAGNDKSFRPENLTESQEVEVKVDMINEDQFLKLSSVISECDKEFIDNVMNGLASMNPPVLSLDKMPASIFDKIMRSADKRRMAYQSRLVQEKQEQYEEISA